MKQIIIFIVIYIITTLLIPNFLLYSTIVQITLGITSSIIAIKSFNKFNIKNKFIKITYILGIILLFAGCLELIEYLTDITFKTNLQHSYQVTDTMIDMLTTFLTGTIIYLISEVRK